MTTQFPSTQDFFAYTYKATKEYCITKYKYEQEYNRNKNILEIELNQLLQDLIEEGLSPRKINASRVMYEKSLETGYSTPEEKKPTNREKAEIIFQFVNDDFGISKNSSAFRMKYYHAEQSILHYYTRYYDIKDELNSLKYSHRVDINELRADILDNGVPLHILNYTYKRLKADIGVLKQGLVSSELDHANDVYCTIKDELLEEIKNV